MAKYQVNLATFASASVEVEAESEEEAIELAFENAPYSCHQCPEIGDWELPSVLYEGDPSGDVYLLDDEEENN